MNAALIAFCVASAIALVACGGGARRPSVPPPDTPSAPETEPQKYREGMLYAYYADDDTSVVETKDHVTHTWAWGRGPNGPVSHTLARLTEAKQYGLKAVLHPEVYGGELVIAEDWLRSLLRDAKALDVLDVIDIVYVLDEPDAYGRSDEEVRAKCASVRKVFAEYGMTVKLAVIYSEHGTPGIDALDIVGFDNYGMGAQVFRPSGPIDDIERLLRPDQGVWLIPPGAQPWNQDPAPFEDRALIDTKVVGIVPFLWVHHDDWHPGGIKDAPKREAYVALGKRIKPVDKR